jgi:hypothetical protein
MTTTDLGGSRLASQAIADHQFDHPQEVVRWMGALQAQDYGQALWAIGVRTQSATVMDVEQSIATGQILRTWPMRGTIHFVPAKDAKWMLQLSAARMLAADARRLQQLELDEKIIGHCGELFYEALHGGKRLSRPDILQLLEAAGISTKNGRGYHILWHLARSGLICIGPREGKQQTFVLLDEWVPRPRQLSRDEALAELASRYFTSHGPATLHDFAWWAGITVADAKAGLEGAKPQLISQTMDGKVYWFASDAPHAKEPQASTVYLLPGFDEFMLGYKDRSAILAAEHAPQVVPGNNGVFQPTIVYDGQIVGTWKSKLKPRAAELTLFPFDTSPAIEPQLAPALARYSNFLSLPCTVAQ